MIQLIDYFSNRPEHGAATILIGAGEYHETVNVTRPIFGQLGLGVLGDLFRD